MATLIGYGSSGSNVTELQNKLRAAGYNIAADGVFGNETKAAVEAYQKANGLGVDGIVGDQTGGSLGLSGYGGGGIPLWTENNSSGGGVSGGTVSSNTGTSVGNSGDLSNYLKQQYASTLESELAGLENAYKQATASLDRTAQTIPQEYETKRNTVAATNALEKQAFDERANAMGLNTGTSGQAQLARSSMYQRDLAGIGAAEANAMADLDLQRAQRQAEYEMALAQAKAESDAALNAALYAEMVRQQELAAAQAAAAAEAATTTKSSGGGGGSTPQYTLGGSGKASSDDRNVYGYTKYLKEQGASNSEIRRYINNEATGLTGTERRELASKYQ